MITVEEMQALAAASAEQRSWSEEESLGEGVMLSMAIRRAR